MTQPTSDPITPLLNLSHLSTGIPLFSDLDGDRYPDRINLVLGIDPNMDSGAVWAGLINLAARLNMESCGPGMATPVPCTQAENGMLFVRRPAGNVPWAACLEQNPKAGWQLSGHSHRAMEQILDTLAMTALSDEPARAVRFELVQEGMDSGRMVDQNGTESRFQTLAICRDVPGRFPQPPVTLDPTAFDITSLADLLLPGTDHDPRGSRLSLTLNLPQTLSAACGLSLFALASDASARATELSLPLAHAGFCPENGLCLAIEENTLPEARISRCGHQLKAAGRSRELAALIREVTRLWFDTDTPGGEALESWKKKLYNAAHLAAAARLNRPEQTSLPVEKTIQRRMTMAGEKARILDQAATLPRGIGPVQCRAFTGGPYPDRLAFKLQLNHVLKQKGYTPETVVLRTHKPAVSWLLETVGPSLPPETHSLTISCRPFCRTGQMEPQARWIREMYPAPDVICDRRGWQTHQVNMILADTQASDYTVTACDASGSVVAGFSLTVPVSELPYRLELRKDQRVYPTQAGFEISRDNRIVHRCAVPTDRELFWRRFQEHWLPAMSAAMIRMLPGLKHRNALAFWEEIQIEVAMDDIQEPVGLAQERVAPMEALHEDLYFGLLAFMESFRQEHCPDSRIQLGRIVPLMRAAGGQKPWACLRLTPMRTPVPPPRPRPAIDHIGYSRGALFMDFFQERPDLSMDEKQRLCAAARSKRFRFRPHETGIRYTSRPARKPETPSSISPIHAPDLQSIPSGETVRAWTRHLSGHPGIRVWHAGTSLLGRNIPAVEATAGNMPARRARLLKPTLLVNARHHANEVSGTNAAMALLHEFAACGRAAGVLDRVNLVVVPLENADGVDTLEKMLPESPDHKLHAARYNALGMEYYDQYFDRDTRISEARVKTRLFERWLPEYLIDLHGVPSHEWEQPFSGYVSPRFKEHWIPRSFVYAILPFYGRKDHPGSGTADALAREMSAALETQTDILAMNQEIFDRYLRYARAFEPDVYDSDMAGALVVTPTCERIGKINFANRKWPLVKSEIITEVLDEVATGPWLEHCVRAHMVIIHTVLKRMQEQEKAVLERKEESGAVIFAWQRRA
ncbi:MAG: M14 family metallopeptidase [Desulfotignum sp.]